MQRGHMKKDYMGSIEEVKLKEGTSYKAVYRNKLLGLKKTKTFNTVDLCERWLRLTTKQYSNVVALARGKEDLTLEDIHSEYIKSSEYLSKKVRTRESEEEFMPRYLKEFGKRNVHTIIRPVMRDWLDKLKETKKSNGEVISSARVRNAFNAISALFTWAVDKDYIENNPCAGIKRPQSESRVVRVNWIAETAIFYALSTMRESRVMRPRLLPYFFYKVLWHTGCRPQELAELRWGDIDFGQKRIALNKHKTQTKTQKPLIKIMHPEVENYFKQLSYEMEKKRYAIRPEDYVFYSYVAGTKIKQPYNYTEGWRSVCRRVPQEVLECNLVNITGEDKVVKLCPYSFRHEFASWSLSVGVSTAVVKELLGHSSLAMLEKHYSHVALVELEGVMQEITNAREDFNSKQMLNSRLKLSSLDFEYQKSRRVFKEMGMTEDDIELMLNRRLDNLSKLITESKKDAGNVKQLKR